MAPAKRAAESTREERAGKRQAGGVQPRIDLGLKVKATKNVPGRKPSGGKAWDNKPAQEPVVKEREASPEVERELEDGSFCPFKVAEAELRTFDMQTLYGPCMSLTRVERFERASKLNLQPPQRVRQILDAFPEMRERSVWHALVL
eukprot:CAMPEP_0180135612 /NCGR_PEP_ID=MMETSP0986-20121125/10948_1 /TAXON_ID=697907 /ORGANISM="non described non described, Strain CCMP2293" /LENGTH=145 /DNA_ID=CAMNT_0022076371 /DNA_START=25 /DNA_END=462 /DNA_ORIENTATION=-